MKILLRNLSVSLAVSSASILAAQPVSVTYSPPTQTTPLISTFVAWDSLTVRPNKNGWSRSVFDARTPTCEKFEVHITTLKPGMMSHPPHHHPWEEMILIKEGSLEASINGQKHRAGPGALIFFASHDVHNLTNVGDQPATYYVINFCTDQIHTVRDQPAAEWAPQGKLPSSVIDCDSLPATATPTGSRRTVVDSPTLTFLRLESHITTLKPGASTSPRTRDSSDEFFVVKSGVIEATVNGVACRLGAGSVFFLVSNDERSTKNISGAPASYQVFKVVSDQTPRPPGE